MPSLRAAAPEVVELDWAKVSDSGLDEGRFDCIIGSALL